jgi:hypothetical protein
MLELLPSLMLPMQWIMYFGTTRYWDNYSALVNFRLCLYHLDPGRQGYRPIAVTAILHWWLTKCE